MKKIGILTFHDADNLGAVLQAFSLQDILNTNPEIKAEIIDYKCEKITSTQRATMEKTLKGIVKYFPMKIYYAIKRYGFNAFRNEFLLCSKTKYNRENIKDSLTEYDIFITGSDQVWNPGCSGGDLTYFLDFVPSSKKKIAYAASIGAYEFKDGEKEMYANLINSFDSISVRESSAKDELLRIGVKEAEVCCDPVLLKDAEEWKGIMPKRIIGQKYVLVYLVQPDVNVMRTAEDYAKKHNCKVISNKKSVEFIFHNSPAEFLSWINYAEAVFTNSFHGTAFSMIFNKPFLADVETVSGKTNSRILNLLTKTESLQCVMKESGADVTSANADEKIQEIRNVGLNYLNVVCKGDNDLVTVKKIGV